MLITILNEKQKFYLVADAYYSVRKMYSKVMAEGGHVISKAKLTAIGYGAPRGANISEVQVLTGKCLSTPCSEFWIYGGNDMN